MLVLTRKLGEEIVINNNIVVTPLRITRFNNIRIGISAPENVTIDRREIYERKYGVKEDDTI